MLHQQITAAPTATWYVTALKNLYAQLQAERDSIPGWYDGDDDTAERANALDAAMEAAESEAAWAAGQAVPLEEIIAEALQEAPGG